MRVGKLALCAVIALVLCSTAHGFSCTTPWGYHCESSSGPASDDDGVNTGACDTVTCATNFVGTPTVATCAADGAVWQVAGTACTPQFQCKAPANYICGVAAGGTAATTETSGDCTTPSCGVGYTGSPINPLCSVSDGVFTVANPCLENICNLVTPGVICQGGTGQTLAVLGGGGITATPGACPTAVCNSPSFGGTITSPVCSTFGGNWKFTGSCSRMCFTPGSGALVPYICASTSSNPSATTSVLGACDTVTCNSPSYSGTPSALTCGSAGGIFAPGTNKCNGVCITPTGYSCTGDSTTLLQGTCTAVTCASGYSAVAPGPSSPSCIPGETWTFSGPPCLQVCIAIPSGGLGNDAYNSACSSGTTDSGSTCDLTCSATGYSGSVTRTCNSGSFTGTPATPSCSPNPCSSISAGGTGNNAYSSSCFGGSTASGGSCTLTCTAVGYGGSSTHSCDAASWSSQAAPTCSPNPCAAIPNDNTSAPKDQFTSSCGSGTTVVGGKCTLTCVDSSGFFGSVERTCQLASPVGSWSSEPLVCQAKCKTPPGYVCTGDGTNSGGTQTVSGVCQSASCDAGGYENTLSGAPSGAVCSGPDQLFTFNSGGCREEKCNPINDHTELKFMSFKSSCPSTTSAKYPPDGVGKCTLTCSALNAFGSVTKTCSKGLWSTEQLLCQGGLSETVYVGCFVGAPVLPDLLDGEFSLSECQLACAPRPYFGLSNGFCYCGTSEPTGTQQPDSNCDADNTFGYLRGRTIDLVEQVAVFRVDSKDASSKDCDGLPSGGSGMMAYSSTCEGAKIPHNGGCTLRCNRPKFVGMTTHICSNGVWDNMNAPSCHYDAALSRFAGNPTQQGLTDGSPAQATFMSVMAVLLAQDSSIYVSDYYVVRKVAPNGVVTTVAGDKTGPGKDRKDGFGTNAYINAPFGLAQASNGDIFVTEAGHWFGGAATSTSTSRGVRKLSVPSADCSSVDEPNWDNGKALPFRYGCNDYLDRHWCKAGAVVPGAESLMGAKNGYPEFNCGACGKPCIGLDVSTVATEANGFQTPTGLAFDTNGNLFVVDSQAGTITKITTPSNVATSVITVVAGGSGLGGKNNIGDGVGTLAGLTGPMAIALDKFDNSFFIAEEGSIRKFVPSTNEVTTFFKSTIAVLKAQPHKAMGSLARLLASTDPSFVVTVPENEGIPLNQVGLESSSGLVVSAEGDLLLTSSTTREVIRITGASEAAGVPYTYLGCYSDDETMDFGRGVFTGISGSGSPVKWCSSFCSSYPYFALFEGEGPGCVCAMAYATKPHYVKSGDNNCNPQGAEFWGGVYQQYNAVYQNRQKMAYLVAGSNVPAPWSDGAGTSAAFGRPWALLQTADKNLIVSDGGYYGLRKLTVIPPPCPTFPNAGTGYQIYNSTCDPMPMVKSAPDTNNVCNLTCFLPGWSGSVVHTCIAGDWESTAPPMCTPNPCAPLDDVTTMGWSNYNSTCATEDAASEKASGSMCSLECTADGYSGMVQHKCFAGQWDSMVAPICKPNPCAPLKDVKNMQFNNYNSTCASGLMSGKTCTLECTAEDYTGSISHTCTAGYWDSTAAPTCIPDLCPPIAAGMKMGAQNFNTTCSEKDAKSMRKHGEMCTLECTAKGYSGSVMRTCDNVGKWDSEAGPVCTPNPCVPIFDMRSLGPQSFSTTCSPSDPMASRASGATCTLACSMLGYSGSVTRTCLAGVWDSMMAPMCMPNPCNPLNDVVNGANSYNSTCATTDAATERASGSKCTLECSADGYTGMTTKSCFAGQWDSTRAPICMPDPCLPMNDVRNRGINNFDSTCAMDDPSTERESGRICTLQCSAPGYSGMVQRTCTAGRWDSMAAPTCKPNDCVAIPAVSTAGPQSYSSSCTTSVSSGTSCTLACTTSGWSGSVVNTCTAGVWSSTAPPTCTPNPCPSMLAGGTGATAYSSACAGGVTASGGTCDLKCTASGWSGSITHTCAPGAWVAVTAPTCMPNPCVVMEHKTNWGANSYNSTCTSAHDLTARASGSSCMLQCITDGYSGMVNRKCFAGSWDSSVGPVCMPNACMPLPAGGAGDQSYSSSCASASTAHGASCTLSCTTKGFTGVLVKTCKAGSFMGPNAPACLMPSVATSMVTVFDQGIQVPVVLMTVSLAGGTDAVGAFDSAKRTQFVVDMAKQLYLPFENVAITQVQDMPFRVTTQVRPADGQSLGDLQKIMASKSAAGALMFRNHDVMGVSDPVVVYPPESDDGPSKEKLLSIILPVILGTLVLALIIFLIVKLVAKNKTQQ